MVRMTNATIVVLPARMVETLPKITMSTLCMATVQCPGTCVGQDSLTSDLSSGPLVQAIFKATT